VFAQKGILFLPATSSGLSNGVNESLTSLRLIARICKLGLRPPTGHRQTVQIRPFRDAPFAKTGKQRFRKVAQGHFPSLKKNYFITKKVMFSPAFLT
jgi:hypothetical protein